MQTINIGISRQGLESSIDILNVLLADESILYTKTRNFHWHVRGISFMEMHKLFEEHYEELARIIDEVAERIRDLGGNSIGSMHEFLEKTRLKEARSASLTAHQMIQELLEDHESIIIFLRTAIKECDENNNDAGSADFLTGIMEEHETFAWMLRSYLQN